VRDKMVNFKGVHKWYQSVSENKRERERLRERMAAFALSFYCVQDLKGSARCSCISIRLLCFVMTVL
jgi:hypothetical protein